MRPSRSGRAHILGATGSFLSLAAIGFGSFALAKDSPSPKAEASPKSPSSLASMPLPIGQEAKGLVLPDFDLQGKMRGRLEAGTAKRTDADLMQHPEGAECWRGGERVLIVSGQGAKAPQGGVYEM